MDFPVGLVIKNLPANAGDVGSVPGPGRFRGRGHGRGAEGRKERNKTTKEKPSRWREAEPRQGKMTCQC